MTPALERDATSANRLVRFVAGERVIF